jgi:HSP20 family molecular chaperone IbpA
MWAEACDLMVQADRLQRHFFRPTASDATSVAWEPPADVYESEREIVVIIAMPGVSSERMQILSEPGVLVVRGTRPLPLVGPGHAVRRLEIPHGQFERRISLPPDRMELGTPESSNGCLILRLRKLDRASR